MGSPLNNNVPEGRSVRWLSVISSIWGRSITTWTRLGGQVVKKCFFLSTFRVKDVHVKVGRQSKMVKILFTQFQNGPLWYTQIELFKGYYPMVQETFLFLDEVEEVCKVIYAPIYIPCFDGPQCQWCVQYIDTYQVCTYFTAMLTVLV